MTDNNINKEVGLKIHNARKNKKMTMKTLGKEVGLHESTVSRYEKGDIQSLDIETIKKFANALEVDASYLLGWANENGEIQGLKKRPSNVIVVNFGDRNIDFIKLDKFRLYKSGIYQTYLDYKNIFERWYDETAFSLKIHIKNLNECLSYMNELFIPFFPTDNEYYKYIIGENLSELGIGLDNLEELYEYLHDLEDGEIDNILSLDLTTKEKKDYLIYYQNEYEYNDLSDDEISDYFNKFMELSKIENEKFKKALGIDDSITLL